MQAVGFVVELGLAGPSWKREILPIALKGIINSKLYYGII